MVKTLVCVYGLVNRDDAIIMVAEVIRGYSRQSFLYRALSFVHADVVREQPELALWRSLGLGDLGRDRERPNIGVAGRSMSTIVNFAIHGVLRLDSSHKHVQRRRDSATPTFWKLILDSQALIIKFGTGIAVAMAKGQPLSRLSLSA